MCDGDEQLLPCMWGGPQWRCELRRVWRASDHAQHSTSRRRARPYTGFSGDTNGTSFYSAAASARSRRALPAQYRAVADSPDRRRMGYRGAIAQSPPGNASTDPTDRNCYRCSARRARLYRRHGKAIADEHPRQPGWAASASARSHRDTPATTDGDTYSDGYATAFANADNGRRRMSFALRSRRHPAHIVLVKCGEWGIASV